MFIEGIAVGFIVYHIIVWAFVKWLKLDSITIGQLRSFNSEKWHE